MEIENATADDVKGWGRSVNKKTTQRSYKKSHP